MTTATWPVLDSLIHEAVANAERKHPHFPTNPSTESEGVLVVLLDKLRWRFNRRDTDADCSIRSIQSEEQLEAIIAAKQGKWKEACEETLHLIATAIRAYDYYLARLEAEKGAVK